MFKLVEIDQDEEKKVMQHIAFVVFITLMAGIMYASVFEWLFHRYVMHRPLGTFRYPFEAHTLMHHRVFKADHTYHVQHEEDKKKIPMAWWNGPVLIIVGTVPFRVKETFGLLIPRYCGLYTS
ncbi:hypothetical protein HY413_03755 [Candidatus Kaiserbacteria bacterium]|nr:hypothetical protein [Candidatus Kaiserbacteria bacterium]